MIDLRRSVLFLMVLFLLFGILSCTPAPDKHFDKGVKYGAQGKLKEANVEFKKVLALNQSYLPAKDCLRLTEDALSNKVKNEVVIHLFNGVIYGNKEMNYEAIAEINKSIAINPNYAEAYYFLGAAYVMNEMFNEGISEYQKAIDINPNFAEVYNNLAIAYYYTEQYKLAIVNYDRSIELGYKADPLFLDYLKPHR